MHRAQVTPITSTDRLSEHRGIDNRYSLWMNISCDATSSRAGILAPVGSDLAAFKRSFRSLQTNNSREK